MPRKPQVHFRLKPEDKNGESLIYLQFIYDRNRLFYSFGQSINPKDWNSNKQRVKKKDVTTADGKHSLNDLLKNLENLCEKTYTEELKNGIPAPETIKRHLDNFIHKNLNVNIGDNNVNIADDIFELIDRFIDFSTLLKSRRPNPRSPGSGCDCSRRRPS